MRIAVTGFSGLIGTSPRRSLEEDGHDVLRVVRQGGGPGTTTWDPMAGEIDASAFEGLDGVVNLAGEPIGARRWTAEQKTKIRESRTRGTTLLAEALASCRDRPPVLVSGSAIGFYGDRGAGQPEESGDPGEGFPTDLVLAWESSAAAAEVAGIRVPRLRRGIVLDGGEARRSVV